MEENKKTEQKKNDYTFYFSNLRFDARTISKIERQLNASFLDAFQKGSLYNFSVFLQNGLDISLSITQDRIDEFLNEGYSIEDLAYEIATALKKGGLLPKAFNPNILRS